MTSRSTSQIASFNLGDAVSITALLVSSDPTESSQGEPLNITSSTGFSAVDSTYSVTQTYRFTASAAGTVSAFITGADGDESATITVTTFPAYAVAYYANASVGVPHVSGAPDAQLRLTNDGNTETNLWAAIYVFNNDEQMEACCSCEVTPDGYLDLDVNHDLLGNQLTPEKATSRGIIKVISSSSSAPQSPTPTAGIRGWLTQIQNGAASSAFSTTESDLKDSVLSSSEETTLAGTCGFVLALGSGAGACSCADVGH